MTHILHVITDLGVGGAEAMLLKLVKFHDRKQFTHAVISLMDIGAIGERLQAEGIDVYALGCQRGLPSWRAIRRLVELTKQLRPDVIQGWMYHGNLAAWLARRFSPGRLPLVWGIRQSLDKFGDEKWLTRAVILANALLSRRVDAVVYNAQRSRAQHAAIGISGRSVQVITNGFDTHLFSPSATDRMAVRQELQIAGDARLVGLVGRFHPMKDHHGFLQAAAEIVRKHREVHFLLVGEGIDWNNPALARWIEQHGLAAHVHLLGHRQDIPRLMAALDIAVSASARNEGFANVIGEAMSCAVPCVVTDVGDSAWIVGDTGKVVPPGNPQKLAEALCKLVAMDLEKRQQLGALSRKRAIAEFSIEQAVTRFEALYSSLVREAS